MIGRNEISFCLGQMIAAIEIYLKEHYLKNDKFKVISITYIPNEKFKITLDYEDDSNE